MHTIGATITVLRYSVDVIGDQPSRGVAPMGEAIATLHATHSRRFLSYHLRLLAQAQMRRGIMPPPCMRSRKAWRSADGERYYVAELHWLKGELLAEPHGDLAGAETAFRAAIEIATRQGANRAGAVG